MMPSRQKLGIFLLNIFFCVQGGGGLGLSQNLASSFVNPNQLKVETNDNRVTSKTAPARLEGFEDENQSSLKKVEKFTDRF